MYIYVDVVLTLSLLCVSVVTVQENDVCKTPNGETAKCIPINSCTVIKQAITYLNEDALNFARASHCGQSDGTHLVCCGSTGNFVKTNQSPMSTTVPPKISEPNVSLLPNPIENLHLPDHSLCGIQRKEFRIIGGTDAELGQFPWMAVLKYANTDGSDAGFRCSGTLINRQYVLTAAQCLNVRNFKLVAVRLGEWKISSYPVDCVQDSLTKLMCAEPVIDVKIKRTIAHPYYASRGGDSDIALLHLAEKINYTDYIRPICLPPPGYPPTLPGAELFIAGWGVNETGVQSDILQKVVVPVVKNEVCARIFSNITKVNLNQVCAGGEEGKDACRGDSGGPLMRKFKNSQDEQWFQEAIIYRGLGCARKGIPALYVRLARYVNWILTEIEMK